MMNDEESQLYCPFAPDFASYTTAAGAAQIARSGLERVPWWLALIELEKHNYSFGEDDASALPYRWTSVMQLIRRKRQEPSLRSESSKLVTSEDLATALIRNSH